jgi:hypothetical protein
MPFFFVTSKFSKIRSRITADDRDCTVRSVDAYAKTIQVSYRMTASDRDFTSSPPCPMLNRSHVELELCHFATEQSPLPIFISRNEENRDVLRTGQMIQITSRTMDKGNIYIISHTIRSGLLNHLPLDSRLRLPSETHFILAGARPELSYSNSRSSTRARPAKREACVQYDKERLQESVLNRHRRDRSTPKISIPCCFTIIIPSGLISFH